MSKNSVFYFQQFSVNQSLSAMKVGTDGVLLGAWASLYCEQGRVLDVGAGTGVVSLILAQNNKDITIDAVEIESDAFTECKYNFQNSPWNDRLCAIRASFTDFSRSSKPAIYSAVISNPPYFSEDVIPKQNKRMRARSTQSLSFEQLISGTVRILMPKGIFCVVIPYSQEEYFTAIARKNNFYLHKVLHIRGRSNTPLKRSLMFFLKDFSQGEVSVSELVLEQERGIYTPQYKQLVWGLYTGKGYQ